VKDVVAISQNSVLLLYHAYFMFQNTFHDRKNLEEKAGVAAAWHKKAKKGVSLCLNISKKNSS
jgi:hypothetical protein